MTCNCIGGNPCPCRGGFLMGRITLGPAWTAAAPLMPTPGFTLTTGSIETCQWCSMYHPGRMCPRVKSIEYFEDGRVKRVEFLDGTSPNGDGK